VAFNAFAYAFKNDMLGVIRVYLLSSLRADSLPVQLSEPMECTRNSRLISLQDVYRYAMQKRQYDIATSVSEHSEFIVNAQLSGDGEPPLQAAVRDDRLTLTNALICRGAKIDALDKRGVTALVVACAICSYKCCATLLGHGANPNNESYNILAKSPLYALLIRWTYEPGNFAEVSVAINDIIELLIAMGIQICEEQRDWVLLYVEPRIGTRLAKLCNVTQAFGMPV